jgi:hypothetical protein
MFVEDLLLDLANASVGFHPGNEIADQLAKEAAKESMSLNEQYNVITMSDVKQAVKTSTKIKWQNRWAISGSGRQLYDP